ncbi:MAG: flagellar hook-basal body complex protein [Saccharospirillum sp.]
MSFGTGLSGVAAANKDLQVTGNNIANASTTGFKASRTEFGDAYTNSFLGTGQNKAGAGVNVENIGQKFEQGNISQTSSALDLAIDGNGFFVTKYPNDNVTYTRSGIFGIDKNGYITSNQGARLQGFGVNQNGIVSGILTDLKVDTGNQPPRGTHNVDSRVNVPAGAQVLQQDGLITRTNGLAVGVAQTGSLVDTRTTVETLGVPTTATGNRAAAVGTDFTGSLPFDASGFTNASIGVQVNIPSATGGTQTVSDTLIPFATGQTYTDLQSIVDDLNRSILRSSDLAGKVEAALNPAGDGFQLRTAGTYSVNGSDFSLTQDGNNLLNALQIPTTLTDFASPSVPLFDNGGSIDLRTIEGTAVSIQGNSQADLTFTDASPGTFTTLTSAQVAASVDGGNFGQTSLGTGDRIEFNASVPGEVPTTLIDVDLNGVADTDDLVTEFNNAFVAAFGSPNTLIASNVGGRVQIETGTDVGEGSFSIAMVQTNNPNNNDNFNLVTLGLDTANSTPGPSQVRGDNPVLANNLLTVELEGGVSGTIQIPAGTYSSYNQLITEINNALQTNANLFGEVEASHLNGRISFTRTVEGDTFDIDVLEGDPASVTLDALGFTSATKTLGVDEIDRSHSFRVNLTVPAPDEENRSGSVEISLNETIISVDQLAAAINRELAAVPEEDYIGVQAEAYTNDQGDRQIRFVAIEAGEASQVSISNIQAPGDDLDIRQLYGLLQVDQFESELTTLGEPAITNGYPEQTFVLFNEEADERQTITIPEGSSASAIAAQLGGLSGVDASAETEVRLLTDNYINIGDMDILINGQRIEANDYRDMVDEINQYQQSTLNGITAELDDETGDVVLYSSTGIDISVSIDSPNAADSLTVRGFEGTAPVVLGGTGPEPQVNAKIGGYVDIILNEGYRMIEPDPRVTGLFNGLTDRSFEPFTINAFNPDDPQTYNDTASLPIYDSLGNQHQLQLFYVKDPDDPNRPRALNSWTVYAQIDGEDVGDPDTSLPFPENTEPTIASHRLFFNADGTLDKENSGEFLISNWNPIDPETGRPNGAYVGLPEAIGGRLPIPDPNTNSNFAIDFGDTTQYGGPFARYNFQQDGYASGRLNDLEIDDAGIVYARYTNGEAQVLGQVALASFASVEGLNPVGQTEWQESFESGDATIGGPGTGLLGSIRSAALEDSTVDLSQQLVQLIIAQRNYQASAKTLETANAVTQTIINLR